jgi:hypothetical protein
LAIAGFVLLIVATAGIVAARLFAYTGTPAFQGACGSEIDNAQPGSQSEVNKARDREEGQFEVDCKNTGVKDESDIGPTVTPTITPPKLKGWLKAA